ncbi:MAG: hypothetical protein PHD07_04490 [Bacteroidales bacterium]|nr:hypothetical protein [Bacteroidales bacterium]MDD3201043.1 hypothetical protein [Bacteroidales bacterium]
MTDHSIKHIFFHELHEHKHRIVLTVSVICGLIIPISTAKPLSAQTIPTLDHNFIRPNLEYGYNHTWGNYTDITLTTDWSLSQKMHITGGLSSSTADIHAFYAGIRYDIPLHFGDAGTLYIDNRYLLRCVVRNDIWDATGTLSAGYFHHHLRAEAGISTLYFFDSNGGIWEPLGFIYLLEGMIFKNSHKWNAGARISNIRPFAVERFYFPTFSLLGQYRISDRLAITAEGGVEPSGIFNMAAQFYSGYINLGLKFLW